MGFGIFLVIICMIQVIITEVSICMTSINFKEERKQCHKKLILIKRCNELKKALFEANEDNNLSDFQLLILDKKLCKYFKTNDACYKIKIQNYLLKRYNLKIEYGSLSGYRLYIY